MSNTVVDQSLVCLEKIFADSMALVLAVRASDKVVVFANGAWEKAMICTGGRVIGKTSLELGLAQYHEEIIKIQEINEAASTQPYEMVYYTTSGEKRFLIGNTVLVKEEGERYIVFINFDITDGKRAEERFQKAFYHNVSPMVISAVSDGRCIEVNQAFLSLMGYHAAEVIGKTSRELKMISDFDRSMVIQCLHESGHSQNYECKVRTKGGELRHCLLSVERIAVDHAECLLTSMTDITERHDMELLLKKNEADLKTAEQIAKLGYFEWEVKSDKLTWSEQMFRNLGYEPGEVNPSAEVYRSMVHPDDLQRVAEYIAFDCHKPFSDRQYRIIKPNGEVGWLHIRASMVWDKNGQLIEMFGTCQDITEQKLSEEQIKKSEHELSLINQIFSQSTFFNNLISGSDANDVIQKKLEQYGVNPREPYYCCVIRGDRRVAAGIDRQSIITRLLSSISGWVWQDNDNIAILSCVDNKKLTTKADQMGQASQLLTEIKKNAPGVSLIMGISGISDDPLNIKELYRRACRSLIVAEVLGKPIGHYEDIGTYEIAFYLSENKQAANLVDKTIGKIAAYDEHNDSNLLFTLKLILEEESLKAVAQKLFVHYNTIIWRKRKIERILGLSLDDLEVKCQLLLHFRMWQIYKAQKRS